MVDENIPVNSDRVTMSDFITPRTRNRAEKYHGTPEFFRRAANVQKKVVTELNEILKRQDFSEDMIREKVDDWTNLFRRKLKQGRAWSRNQVYSLIDMYRRHLEEKSAQEEENDSEPIENLAVTTSDEEE